MTTFTYNTPTVGGSEDTWGATLNANWTALGSFIGTLDSAELAVLDGITATTAELNYVDGVTSPIQTQLNAKGDITGVTAGGGLTGGGNSGTVTISHTDTSSQASVNNSGSVYIQDITLDTYGHVTAIVSTTVPDPTTTQVRTATAGIAAGAVGSYAFLRADNTATATAAGTTVAGSTMRYGDINFSKSGTPAGTWRCMGYAASRNYATVYMRIS